MEKEEERKAAIEALNGHNLHGRDISVEASKSRGGGNKRTKYLSVIYTKTQRLLKFVSCLKHMEQ